MDRVNAVLGFVVSVVVAAVIRNVLLPSVISAYMVPDTSGWSPAAAILFQQVLPISLLALSILAPFFFVDLD